MHGETCRQRAQSAQRQPAVVGARRLAQGMDRLAQRRPGLRRGGDRAHQQVGVAADVLGDRMHDDVGAEPQRLAVERRRPGVVDHHGRAVAMRDRGDRRNVLHLEGVRARRLDVDHARRRAHQPLDAGTDARVVDGCLDAVLGEPAYAEAARRPVDAVGQQHVLPVVHVGDDRQAAGSEARREGPAVGAALQLVHRLVQRVMRRRAIGAVGDGLGIVSGVAPLHAAAHLRHRRMQHGGAAHQRRVDELGLRRVVAAMTPARDQARVVLHRRAVVTQLSIRPGGSGTRRRRRVSGSGGPGATAHAGARSTRRWRRSSGACRACA